MIKKLYLNPDAGEATGGTATSNPTQPPTPVASSTPTQETQQTLTVGLDYLNTLLASQTRLAEIERQAEEERQRLAAERDQLIAESTQHRQAFEQSIGERDQRIAALTDQLNGLRHAIQRERVGRTVADAMAGFAFASEHARKQMAEILASRVAVSEQNGDYVVTSPTGTSGYEHLKSLITSEEFAHYLAPTSRGGAGGGGNTVDTTQTPPPMNRGEAALLQARERIAASKNDHNAPVGLGRLSQIYRY